MIKEEWGANVSDEERNQYLLEVCELCKFYPCECTREFRRFAGNHFKDSEKDEQKIDLDEDIIPIKKNVGNCYTVKPASVKLAEDFGQGDNSVLCNPISVNIVNEKEETAPRIQKRYMLDVPLSYDREKMKNGCIMNRYHVIQVECAEKRVAEGIGEDYRIELECDGTIKTDTEDRWEPQQPIFISAQTGQGKNYFVEHILIPYVRELNNRNKTNHKVLILSNRLALRQQIKGHLGGNCDLEGEDEKVYYYNAFADVMTYQSILCNERRLKWKQKNDHARYIFVICDEAHFFTTDAMFNPYTHKILQKIVEIFQDAIRVYMSATPYECLEYIIKCENIRQDDLNWNKPYRKQKGQKMVFYHFKRDYSYLDVKTYFSIDELYGEIIDSVNRRKEKWLIFIDDKERCKTVKEKLELFAKDKGCPLTIEDDEAKRKSEKVFAVDADSKKNPIYQEILNAEKLNKDTYILISTSVLDNGINLTGIKNIVVSDMIKEKCLQMLGRARVSEANDHKTLYIKRFSADEVDKRIKSLMRQQDAYHKYDLAYDELGNAFSRDYGFFDKYYGGNEMDWREAKHWFGKPISESATKLYLNEIARSLVERLIPQYQCILDEMNGELKMCEQKKQQEGNCVGQKYLEYQLSWFGKKYCEDDDMTLGDKKKVKKEFLDFLKSYAEGGEQIVDKGEESPFRVNFTKLYDAAFGRKEPNLKRIYNINKMNKLLQEENIDYKVNSKSAYWVVESI